MTYHLAVDIGGTFTDLVALDVETGEVRVDKSASLARDPIKAVLRVIGKTDIPPSDIELFVHGTTVTTNALIERRGTRVAFITNRGFRDVIFIQNANRRDLYSLDWKKPRPLASRYDCLEIGCRVDSRARAASRSTRTTSSADRASSPRKDPQRRHLVPLLLPEPGARGGGRAPPARGAAGISISLSHLVYPRWRENDRGHTTIADGVSEADAHPLHREPAAGLPRGRLARAPAGDEVQRRRRRRRRRADADELPRLRPGRRRARRRPLRRAGRPRQHHDPRYRRDLVRRLPDGRREVTARRELRDRARHPGEGADGRHPDDRRRRRLDRLDRRGRPLARRAASAGSNPGPACYGQGGTDATIPTPTSCSDVSTRTASAAATSRSIRKLARAAVDRLAERLGQTPSSRPRMRSSNSPTTRWSTRCA